MLEKTAQPESGNRFSIPTAGQYAAIGKKRIEEFVNVQTELLDELQETNQQWFDRMQSEANLASEFASKFTHARSIPDAMTACQEWAARRYELAAEDSKHVLADTLNLMKTGSRLLLMGWLAPVPAQAVK
jgi:hypothetical protein